MKYDNSTGQSAGETVTRMKRSFGEVCNSDFSDLK